MMNEHPILFSSEMVKAILDGRKTMTRRVMKNALDGSDWAGSVHPDGTGEGWIAWWPDGTAEMTKECYPNGGGFKCPYGQPGDLLWVRETWASHPTLNKVTPKYLDHAEIYYRATCDNDSHYSWRPSIHMPRWASRITLEVTSVRVERVRDISEDDAKAEGVTEPEYPDYSFTGWATAEFAELWDKINAKRGYSWDSNPWVWVVEFKAVK